MISLNKYLESLEFENDSIAIENILENIQELLGQSYTDFLLSTILIL